MSSTEGLKKKYKEELAKLRLELVKATGDSQEMARLATMMSNREKILRELGAR